MCVWLAEFRWIHMVGRGWEAVRGGGHEISRQEKEARVGG